MIRRKGLGDYGIERGYLTYLSEIIFSIIIQISVQMWRVIIHLTFCEMNHACNSVFHRSATILNGKTSTTLKSIRLVVYPVPVILFDFTSTFNLYRIYNGYTLLGFPPENIKHYTASNLNNLTTTYYVVDPVFINVHGG